MKPGGTLIYCTCSTTFDENEGLVQWAVKEFGNILSLLEPTTRFTPVIKI